MRNSFVYILLATLAYYPTAGQGLCDSDAAVADGFSLVSTVGCSPFNVKPKNLTDWTEVKYVFGYTDQEADELASLNPSEEDVFFAGRNGKPKTYTILQFGTDANGKERYSCQQVSVRANNEPKFSYTTCNGRILNLTIPENSVNNFDSYVIDWGDGNSQSLDSVPFETTYAFPTVADFRIIKVEGVFETPIAGCPSASSITIPMSDGGNYPNIDSLILSDDKTLVEFDFDGLNVDYQLFKRASSGLFDNNNNAGFITEGRSTLNLSNPEDQVCFATFRNSGGCFESSGEVCTIPLELVETTAVSNTISWLDHPLGTNTLFGSNGESRNVTYSILKFENGMETILSNVTSPYVDPIECTKDYCYQIQTEVTGIPKFGAAQEYKSISLSNKICVNREDIKPDPLTDLQISYLDDTSKEVSFVDDSDWPIERQGYYLYEAKEISLLDSLGITLNRFETTSMESCFFIKYKDICGSLSQSSPEVCVVELQTEDDISLSWTPNNPFSNESIDLYQIFAFSEGSGDFIYLTDRSNAFQNLKPDLESFTNEAKFKVRVIGSAGGESYSNAVSLPLEFKVFLPEVVTPNNDGINDFLELKGSLLRAQEISLIVFDRWGRLQYESSDVEPKWYPNEGLPNGNYLYRINAKLLDGSPYEKNGVIQIAR